MNPFRAYLKVKIQEGKMEAFTSAIPEMVQLVKTTEPQTLQFEAFVHRAKREVIWLESYVDNTGYDIHLLNPALEAIRMKMMPLQESILDAIFMDEPTNQTLEGLKAFGLEAKVAKPRKVMNRLTEDRSKNNIHTIAMVNFKNEEILKAYMEQFHKEAQQFPGYLFHGLYHLNDLQYLGYGEWATAESLGSWMSDIFPQKLAKLFESAIDGMSMDTTVNTMTDSLQILANEWNTPCFEKVDGFIRY